MTTPSPFARTSGVGLSDAALQTLSAAISSTTDGFAILDENGEHAFIDAAYHRTYGYSTPEELLGEPWSVLYEDREVSRLQEEALPDVCERGQWRGEATGKRADGSTFDQEVSFAEFVGDTFLVCIAEDVPERRQEEAARERQLRWERTLFDELLSTVPVGIAIMDATGDLTRVNDRALELLGVRREELVAGIADDVDLHTDYADGRSFADLGGPVDRVIETGSSVTDELVVVEPPDGEPSLFEVSAVPVVADDGDLERVIVTGEDVTEHHESIQRLRQSNEQLERFAHLASHDLKEPLRMVSSFLRLLETRYGDELDDEAREFLDFAVSGADHMRAMVDDLLEFSRISTADATFEPVDSQAVFDDVLADHERQLEETDGEVDASGLPTVYADEGQLRHLFDNLLANAITYSGDEPPEIEISADRRGTYWEFSVADRGIGVDLENPDRIFDVFERGRDDGNGGTGIGLAICREIVNRHGGRIGVDTEPGEGTTFTFTLPTAEGHDDG